MTSELCALQQEVEELLQFVYLMPVALARFGPSGEVTMLNPKAVQLLEDLDIDSGRTDGPAILDVLSPALSNRWRETAGRVGEVGEPQLISPSRPESAALHLLLRLVRTDPSCTMLVIEDVTKTVEQEREIGRQRRRLVIALEHIQGYCVVMLDSAGAAIEWNPSIGRLFGFSEDSVVGRPLLAWQASAASSPSNTFDDIHEIVSKLGVFQSRSAWRKADGQLLWGDCVVTPLVEIGGSISGYVAVIRDVTDEHITHLRLVDEAFTDPLTGLFNRRGLENRLDVSNVQASTAPIRAWIMADVDHFKRVNDTFGHDVGDAVLRAVADALRTAARDGDTLARYGGEEFVMLLPGATLPVAARVAERLRRGVAALVIEIAGQPLRVTASFGVAVEALNEPWTKALERADAAMYEAKREGRDRVEIASAPHQQARRSSGSPVEDL